MMRKRTFTTERSVTAQSCQNPNQAKNWFAVHFEESPKPSQELAENGSAPNSEALTWDQLVTNKNNSEPKDVVPSAPAKPKYCNKAIQTDKPEPEKPNIIGAPRVFL